MAEITPEKSIAQAAQPDDFVDITEQSWAQTFNLSDRVAKGVVTPSALKQLKAKLNLVARSMDSRYKVLTARIYDGNLVMIYIGKGVVGVPDTASYEVAIVNKAYRKRLQIIFRDESGTHWNKFPTFVAAVKKVVADIALGTGTFVPPPPTEPAGPTGPAEPPPQPESLKLKHCRKRLNDEGIEDKGSFRKWALKNHPDRGGDTAKFQEISDCMDAVFPQGGRRKSRRKTKAKRHTRKH